MKLLFDENLSFKLSVRMQDVFPGSLHVSELGLKQVNDIDIWNFAKREGYAIVSKDAELIVTFPNLFLYDMNQDVACRAAYFHAAGIKHSDAIHAATAVVYKADYFVTGDKRLFNTDGINGLGLSSIDRLLV